MISPIVSSKWLHENLGNSDLILLDASDMDNKAGLTSEFENQKIRGARYFDLKNTFSDPNGVYPNTFPSEEQFTNGCRSLGINNSSTIIVYDNLGIYSSPRVWWMFKVMGHEKVHVLNGGLPDWVRNGFETVTYYNRETVVGDFTSKLHSARINDIDFIQSNISDQHSLLIDARSEGRFNGTAKEPREGLRSGSIPNSINIPYSSLLTNGKFKPENELLQIYRSSGVDDRPLVFSCGSGVTACIVLLASEMILDNVTSVYDGSWTEWASLNP
ncbi:MAG: sulfurtransferase [Cyclobacteriaceae bacterium]